MGWQGLALIGDRKISHNFNTIMGAVRGPFGQEAGSGLPLFPWTPRLVVRGEKFMQKHPFSVFEQVCILF